MTVDFTTYLNLPHGERHLGDILNLTRTNFDRYATAIIEAGEFAHKTSHMDLTRHYESIDEGCYAGDYSYADKITNELKQTIVMWETFVQAWLTLRAGGRVKLRDILHGLALVTREAQTTTGPRTHCEYYSNQLLTWGWQEIMDVSDEMEVYVV